MRAMWNASKPPLEWMDPMVRVPKYELHAGDEVLARLSLEPLCRTFATVETAEGRWTFKQTGILATLVHIREAGVDQDLAVFHPGFLGRGLLRFTDGETFLWRRAHHDGGWSFQYRDGSVLLTLRLETPDPNEPWPRRTRVEVDIAPEGRGHPRLSLLTAVGWFLMLLHPL
ncbi:hypothetical protein [Geothrix sp. SG200]|uniref:hypothetical protein n=1 Tax=Geothrix sp. SG200 TaxID=2922865 RepID=UPI001FAE3ACF|nr:hypothetical protein [Geothrix sp. SG200]